MGTGAIRTHPVKATAVRMLTPPAADGRATPPVTLAVPTLFIFLGSSKNPAECGPRKVPSEEPVNVDSDRIGQEEGAREKQVEACPALKTPPGGLRLSPPRQGACSPQCLLVAPPYLVTEGADQAFQVLLLVEDHLLLLIFLLQLHFQLAELWAQRADSRAGETSSLWTNPTRQGPSPGGGDNVEIQALHPVPQRLPWQLEVGVSVGGLRSLKAWEPDNYGESWSILGIPYHSL